MTAIDYSPLTVAYDAKAARALALHLRTTVPTGRRFRGMGVVIDWFGGAAFVLGFIVLFPVGVVHLVRAIIEGDGELVWVSLVMIGAGVGFGAFAWWLLRRYFRPTGSPELWWRLDRFAAANGMVFAPWSPEPAFPSAMFRAGFGAATYNHVRREGDSFINIGNLYYQTGTPGNETFDKRWGFVAIHLAQRWPAMLLDSTKNNPLGMNGIPLDLAGTSLLRLSGPGSETFDLFGRSGDLARGKKVFTPAFVEALATGSRPYDVHLVDDWMFILSRTEFDMADPALLAELFGYIELVRSAEL